MLNLNWQIIWVFVNLLVFYLLLKRFLFKPVTALMDRRAQNVQDTIDQAKKEREEAQTLKQQYAQRLRQAQQEASELVGRAREEASRQAQQILAQAQEDAARVAEEAGKAAQREREQAMAEVRASLSEIVLLTAAKVAQKNMDEESNRQLVDAFLAETGARP